MVDPKSAVTLLVVSFAVGTYFFPHVAIVTLVAAGWWLDKLFDRPYPP